MWLGNEKRLHRNSSRFGDGGDREISVGAGEVRAPGDSTFLSKSADRGGDIFCKKFFGEFRLVVFKLVNCGEGVNTMLENG